MSYELRVTELITHNSELITHNPQLITQSSCLITRNRRINLQRPRIDATRHALRISESMSPQISSCIEAAHSVMTHGDDRGVLRPRLHDLLRQALIDQDASG